MLGHVTPYTITLFLSVEILLVLAFLTWRWRNAPGGRPLFLWLIAVAEWALATAIEAWVVGIPNKILWSQISYLGITSAPALFLMFALEYSHHENFLSRRDLVMLWVVPVMTLGLAATNQWHGLIWPSFTPAVDLENVLIYGHGLGYWVFVAYAYTALLVGAVLLVQVALRGRYLYRQQAWLLLPAVIIPWIGNILYVFRLGPVRGQDLAPVAFGITGLLLTVNMYQFRLLDLAPVARDALIETMREGVLVLDLKYRIVDVNPAARELLRIAASAIGQEVEPALASWPELAEACLAAPDGLAEIRLGETLPRYLEVRATPLRDRDQRLSGRLIVLRDITRRRRAEEERERLVVELQEALANVKTLHGLLPICANCKKIRDDEGYWHSVETYVADHSDAEFSHGLCPDCMKELYPWYRPGESRSQCSPATAGNEDGRGDAIAPESQAAAGT